MTLHYDLPAPIKARVFSKVFYDLGDLPSGVPDVQPCTLFAVSSYKGHTLTFKVIVESTGAVFDYVPPHYVVGRKVAPPKGLVLADLVYSKLCPSMEAVVIYHSSLAAQEIHCWFPLAKQWVKGKYHCTLDWYGDNENANLIELETGQFALVPNHKMVVGSTDNPELPSYKKLRAEWKKF